MSITGSFVDWWLVGMFLLGLAALWALLTLLGLILPGLVRLLVFRLLGRRSQRDFAQDVAQFWREEDERIHD